MEVYFFGWHIFQCRCGLFRKILDVTEREVCDIRTDIQQENGLQIQMWISFGCFWKICDSGDWWTIQSHGAVNADASDGDRRRDIRKMPYLRRKV